MVLKGNPDGTEFLKSVNRLQNQSCMSWLYLVELPGLPPMESVQHHREEPQVDSEWGDTDRKDKKLKHTSGPKTTNPYTSDESWFMPITVAIAIFLPVLFFLCRVR